MRKYEEHVIVNPDEDRNEIDGTPRSNTISTAQTAAHWYSGLTANHIRTLWCCYLGWMFDGYEQYAVIIGLPSALQALLSPEQFHRSSIYFGLILCFTLIGWGVGGLAGGMLADYLGRKRMMMISVFAYALFSALSAFSQSFTMLAVFRFMTGLAIGSEWSTGVTLIAETWPDKARAKGCGFLQSAIGAGMLIAVSAWYLLMHFHPAGQNWRTLFLIGGLPAFLVLYLRRGLEESERWATAVKERQWSTRDDSGTNVASADGKRPFPLSAIWRDRESRARLFLTSLLSLTTVIGWWTVSTLLPQFANQLANQQHAGPSWGSRTAMLYLIGAIVAYCFSGFLIDLLGRRKFIAFSYLGALILTPITYLWTGSLTTFLAIAFASGFLTQGCCYAWSAIYVSELFSSTVRATACSFVFNVPRFVAALFPVGAGLMIESLGGTSRAAVTIGCIYVIGVIVPWFLPETVGQKFPQ